MKTVSRKLIFTKLLIVFAAGLFFAAWLAVAPPYEKARASASGPSTSHTGAPGEANCSACHAGNPVNSNLGSVSITGVPRNYLPNQQYPITVTVSQADATIYGFQLTAIDNLGRRAGTYTLPSQFPLRIQQETGIVNGQQRQYVHHTVDGVIPAQFGSNSWTFTWTAPAQRVGRIGFYAAGNGANSDGQPGGDYIYTTSRSALSGTAVSNFDTDARSDVAVFRPSTGVWYAQNSSNGQFQAVGFGTNGDKIVPGDYDGDGTTDFAVFRPSTGVWYVQRSSGGFIITQFGTNGDIPVPGDYDGDLKSDLAVWRPSTGVWYIFRSSNSAYDIRQFGISTDKIAQGDYDADGKTDIAVFRPSTGVWYVQKSTDFGYLIAGFGLSGDRPVQGDYDGDGRTDFAVYRPSTQIWYLQRTTAGFGAFQFGAATDVPVPADFDGDGKTDAAVFRNGTWYVLRSTDNTPTVVGFGLAGDIPVPSGYLAE